MSRDSSGTDINALSYLGATATATAYVNKFPTITAPNAGIICDNTKRAISLAFDKPTLFNLTPWHSIDPTGTRPTGCGFRIHRFGVDVSSNSGVDYTNYFPTHFWEFNVDFAATPSASHKIARYVNNVLTNHFLFNKIEQVAGSPPAQLCNPFGNPAANLQSASLTFDPFGPWILVFEPISSAGNMGAFFNPI